MAGLQKDLILSHLKEFGAITPLEALEEYSCFRLAAVIHVLRETEGIPIKTKMKKHTTRRGRKTKFAKYILLRKTYARLLDEKKVKK
jgi:hypothetical protein